jgi:hypothetical protein
VNPPYPAASQWGQYPIKSRSNSTQLTVINSKAPSKKTAKFCHGVFTVHVSYIAWNTGDFDVVHSWLIKYLPIMLSKPYVILLIKLSQLLMAKSVPINMFTASLNGACPVPRKGFVPSFFKV